MINNFLLLPVLIPLLFGIAVMIASSLKFKATWIAILGGAFTAIASVSVLFQAQELGAYAYHFGNWPAPFGIVFVADVLAGLMISVSSLMGFSILIYGSHELKDRKSYGLYLAFILILLASINGAFLTGDIFNLYVWFEVMLISSFALMVMDSDKKQIIGSVQYVILNLISTMIFLLAIGILYGHTGSLNMADLHYKAAELSTWTKSSLMSLFFIGFAIKASLFPFYAWVPAAYPKLPNTILAFFAGLLTKVGVYAMLRVFTLIFPLNSVDGWTYFFGIVA
ncbi:proton-conducting transporter membrane subunit, partial [Fibrobacterales bacterium]|nr:proton-conducting transporter membrane subunit [Fibrobacterales bacterium]